MIVPLADHRALIPIVTAWHWREWGDDADPSEFVEAWADRLARRAGRDTVPFTLVAFLEQEPVGAVSVCWDDLDEELANRGPWVSGMIVRGPARNLGVGRSLLRAAEARSSAAGHKELWLHTGEAAGFYRRCGWQLQRARPGLGRDAVLRRRLDGSSASSEGEG